MIYVSRYSNPELASGKYTAVKISIGAPKWPLRYGVTGEMKILMPWGMLRKYSHEEFVTKYREKLDSIGVEYIRKNLDFFRSFGKPVVLLCFEDIRVPGQTCHRTTFGEWWTEKTGEKVEELFDPSEPKLPKQEPEQPKPEKPQEQPKKPTLRFEQCSLFGGRW